MKQLNYEEIQLKINVAKDNLKDLNENIRRVVGTPRGEQQPNDR